MDLAPDSNTLDRPSDEPLRWISWKAAVPIILLLGVCLRIYQLNARSFWIDEAVSMKIAAANTFGDLMRAVAADTHPPLFYILLHFWLALLGNTDLAARLLSVVWGGIGMIGVYVLCRYGLRCSPGTSNFALLLTAVLPFHVYYSQEARSYTMLFALTCFALTFIVRAHCHSRVSVYLCFGVLEALMMWTHYIALIYCAVLNLVYLAVCLICRELTRARLKGWLASGIAGILLYSPVLPLFWRQLHNPVVSNFSASAGSPSLLNVGLVYVRLSGIWKLDILPPRLELLYVLVVVPVWILVTLGSLRALKRKVVSEIVLVVFLFAFPLVILVISRCFVPIWEMKVFVPSAIGVPVIAALGAARLSASTKMKVIQRTIAALSILIGLFSSMLWIQTYQKVDWRGVGNFISKHAMEGDVILVHRDFEVTALERYVGPRTRLIGIRGIFEPATFLDGIVKRSGSVPNRLIFANAYSGEIVERIKAGLLDKYSVTEQEKFYGVILMVFSRFEQK